MKCHIHVSIRGALRMTNGTRSDQNQVKRLFGYEGVSALRLALEEMQRQGRTVVPSEDCDNQAPTGECLGHPDKVAA